MSSSAARIDRLEVSAYTVPTEAPEADGTFAWDATTIVVIAVAVGDTVGLGWTYAPGAAATVAADLLGPLVLGTSPWEIPRLHRTMEDAARNAPRPGLVTFALSAIDNAVWDLRARLLGMPLDLSIGRCRDAVPVYGSGGFTTYDEAALTAELEGWAAAGIGMVKIKIGEACGGLAERDLLRTLDALDVIGPDAILFVDANGGYGRKQALKIGRELADLGVAWFEEPVSSDDLQGLAMLRDRLDVEVTAGEYGTDLDTFHRLAGVVDCLQVDVTRCGGITSWLRIAAMAQAHHLEVSGHCAPAQHLGVAAATPNLRHLEYFADHARIESMLFDGVVAVEHGVLTPSGEIGNGLRIDRRRAEPYRIL